MQHITVTLDHPDLQHLMTLDPLLRRLFEQATPFSVTLSHEPFSFMVFTVLGQQLSTKVADLLFARLQAATQPKLSPSSLLSLSFDALRALGLSNAKAHTLLRLAQATLEGYLNHEHFTHGSTAAMKHLRQLKGIGPWSAEMFVMFVLDDIDVFSVRDLGLYKAYTQFFNLALTPQQLEEKSAQWSPYRAWVAHALWHVWDTKETKN